MTCNKENKKSVFIPSSEVISLLRFFIIFSQTNIPRR